LELEQLRAGQLQQQAEERLEDRDDQMGVQAAMIPSKAEEEGVRREAQLQDPEHK
jgi:hypothetical protein